MTKRQEAARLVLQGHPPSEVAIAMGIDTIKVREHLLLQVAEGELMRSDVALSIPSDTRRRYEATVAATGSSDYWAIIQEGRSQGYDEGEFRIYCDFRNSLSSDVYQLIEKIDRILRQVTQQHLIKHFGPGETRWWKRGVNEKIRFACALSREADPHEPADAFSYATIQHLGQIISDHWETFSEVIPKCFALGPRMLKTRTEMLDRVRNKVLNPSKGLAIHFADYEVTRRAFSSLKS